MAGMSGPKSGPRVSGTLQRLRLSVQDFQYGAFMQFGRGRIDDCAQGVGVPTFLADDLTKIFLRGSQFDYSCLLSDNLFHHKLIRMVCECFGNNLNQFSDLMVAHLSFSRSKVDSTLVQ